MRQSSIAAFVVLFVVSLLVIPASASDTQAKSTDAKASPAPVVNLNTAAAEQLERLPGVGARMAARIVEYRQKNGGFKKIEELMNVRGIGEKAFLRMKSQLTVTAPKADPQ